MCEPSGDHSGRPRSRVADGATSVCRPEPSAFTTYRPWASLSLLNAIGAPGDTVFLTVPLAPTKAISRPVGGRYVGVYAAIPMSSVRTPQPSLRAIEIVERPATLDTTITPRPSGAKLYESSPLSSVASGVGVIRVACVPSAATT